MPKIYSLLLLFTVCIFFTDCKKEEPPITKADILTSKKWKVVAYTVFPPMEIGESGVYTSDLYEYAYFSDCYKNAAHIFNTDGTGKIDYPCYDTDENFTWDILEENNTMHFRNTEYEILKFDDTQLIIRSITGTYPYYTITFYSF